MNKIKKAIKSIVLLALYAFALIWNLPKKVKKHIAKQKPYAIRKKFVATALSLVMVLTAFPFSSTHVNALADDTIQDITTTGIELGTATAFPTQEVTYKAGNGTAVWTPLDADGVATLTFTDATINYNGGIAAIKIDGSTQTEFNKLNVVFNGVNNITSNGNGLWIMSETVISEIVCNGSVNLYTGFTGIRSDAAETTIVGDGNLTAISDKAYGIGFESYGIFARNDLKILSGNITATTYETTGLGAAIGAMDGKITIGGDANVRAFASGNCSGIRTRRFMSGEEDSLDITIDTTGTVYALSKYGIFADRGNLTIKNGTVYTGENGTSTSASGANSLRVSSFNSTISPIIEGGDVYILGAQTIPLKLDGGVLTNKSTEDLKYTISDVEYTLGPNETTRTSADTKTVFPVLENNSLSGTSKTTSFDMDILNSSDYTNPVVKVYSSMSATEVASGVTASYENGKVTLKFDEAPQNSSVYYFTLTNENLTESDKSFVLMSITTIYDVVTNLNGLTFSGANEITKGSDYSGTFAVIDSINSLPESIIVSVSDTNLADTDYTYDKATGTLTIPADKITGTLTIIAEALIPQPVYTVTIPATLDFGDVQRKLEKSPNRMKKVEDLTVSANTSYLFANSKKLSVTLSSDFTLSFGENKLAYDVYDEKDALLKTDSTVLDLNYTDYDTDKITTAKFYATLDQSQIRVGGKYTGTLTFTVALDDIA